MKIKGFLLRHFISSSPIIHVSGRSIYMSNSPFLFLFRHFCTTSVSNCNFHEKMKLGNIRNLVGAYCLYVSMSTTRPLPNVKQFNQLLSRVVNHKEYSTAIYLFKDICKNSGSYIDEYTMNIAINSYCLSNQADLGFSILGCFFKRGCVPNEFTFTTLLKGLFRENKINEAQELFRKMGVVKYGTVIDGLCKAGNTPMALELLGVMEKGSRSRKPGIRIYHIYSMIIDRFCKGKKVESILKLLNKMPEKGIPPNVVTYSDLICGLCNLSRWSEAKMLMEKMVGCKKYPNVIKFSSLVGALCKEGLVDEAADVIHIMKQQNVTPNVVTYSALMDGYCLQGRVDEARNVFDSMSNNNIVPDISCYNTLMNGFCEKKKIDEVIHLFRDMPRKGVEPNVASYNTVLQGLFRCGRDSCALKLFDEMHAVGIKMCFYTYCYMLDGLCSNGQAEGGLLLLDAIEHKGGGHHRHYISYNNIVMDGFCKAKKLDAARGIFNDLASKGLQPNEITYTTLIRGCFENGLLEEAKDILLKMEQATKQVCGPMRLLIM
ncbi:hypothetical protein CASFOL_023936 [Castilleja foliolosa]|uniref:Pentatricopeptide repeat-containing protein n=1 Tax=Castilleja foliolosa TaxID=1961234 RepID=A0ABD3CNA6_9LAMI